MAGFVPLTAQACSLRLFTLRDLPEFARYRA